MAAAGVAGGPSSAYWLEEGWLAAGRRWLTLSVPPSVLSRPVCVEAVSVRQTQEDDGGSVQPLLMMGRGGQFRTATHAEPRSSDLAGTQTFPARARAVMPLHFCRHKSGRLVLLVLPFQCFFT